MKTTTITFIGGGNMARAIIAGLIANGYANQKIWVTNRTADKLTYFADTFGVQTTQNNIEAAELADVVVFAVKPHQIQTVSSELKNVIAQNKPLVISLAAGVTTELLHRWLSADTAMIRAISNMPAMVNAGATVLYANGHTHASQRELAESIFRAVGIVLWLENEDLLHAVTGLSSSGPAYFFLFMEVMQEVAESFGLSQEMSQLLVLQTALGAARVAIESTYTVEELRQAVTSAKGTTAAGLAVLQQSNFREIIAEAISAAVARSKELTNLMI